MGNTAPFQGGDRARELHAAGKSCNAIARELGCSSSTISRWAKREGLSFDRSETAAMVSALRIDRAAVRADIIDRMYTRSQKILARLEASSYTYRAPTKDGTEVVTEDSAPPIDEKNFASAIAVYLDKAARLELVDSDSGVSGAKSMLADLGKAFGIVAAQ